MFSYWAYILIGDNNTGKTGFQKYLVSELCDQQYQRLRRNRESEINNPRMPQDFKTLSMMNRSYQEVAEYRSVTNFFRKYFVEADICILSSHANPPANKQLREMIRELRLRAYNVAAVFFSNGYNNNAAKISLLDWDERLWLENPEAESEKEIQNQIERLAKEFTQFLMARAAQQ